MPSFDITSEINKVELNNALDQANKEITNRFDFKGSDARIEEKELVLSVFADDDFKLKQVLEVFTGKCAKRGIDVRAFDMQTIETISGGKVKQTIKVRNGIETEMAKKIVRTIKDAKLKVQAGIQGEAVRVSGAKKDDLQACMQRIRGAALGVPLQFQNFRE